MPIELPMSLLSLILLLIQWFMPNWMDPQVPFGVQVPPERVGDPVVQKAVRLYRSGIAVIFLLLMTTWIVGFSRGSTSWFGVFFPIQLICVVALGLLVYYIAHQSVRQAKQKGNWMAGHRQVLTADTNARQIREPVSWLWSVPVVLVILAGFVTGIWYYPHIPHVFAMHYDASGQANRWAAKSVGSVFSLSLVQLGMLALMIFIHITISRAHITLDPNRPRESAALSREKNARLVRSLWVFFFLVNLGMMWTEFVTWGLVNTTPTWMMFGVFIPIIIGLIVLLFVLVTSQRHFTGMPASSNNRLSDVRRDEDRNWVLGFLYVNREDSRWMVEKRFGIGWTVNFAHPGSWIVIGVIIVAAVLVPLVSR